MVEPGDETTTTDELMTGAIRPGGMVLIGEIHGTHEFPRLVGQLAGLAVDRQLPVLVGLELPSSEQATIDTFLAGPGGPPEVAALTAADFWHRPPERDDGRSGQALVELLAAVRSIAARGLVRVCAFDLPWAEEGTIATPEQAAIWTMPRDRYMADTLTGAVEQLAGAGHGTFTVVLAGSMHTRIVRYPGFDEAHQAELLIERFPHLIALEGHWSGGRYRAMTSPRGAEVHDAYPDPTRPGSVGSYGPEQVRQHGHHGWVNVGLLTPSLPLP